MYKQLSIKQLVIAEMVLIYTKEHLQYKETKGHYEKVTETIKIMSRYAARNILSQLHKTDMSRSMMAILRSVPKLKENGTNFPIKIIESSFTPREFYYYRLKWINYQLRMIKRELIKKNKQ